MSKHCEDIRPLIAELVYGEVDSDTAEQVREHLGSCLPCRRYQTAFLAVREDLQEWQPEAAHEPRGITFIAPRPRAAPQLWRSRVFQGLALAAGFFFAAFLMAAVVNLQVESGPDGWAVSTSLWETPAGLEQAPDETLRTNNPTTQQPTRPQLVALDEVPGSGEWLERQLAARGYVPAAELPQELTQAQWEQVAEVAREVADASVYEHDVQSQELIRNLLAASEAQQTDRFFMTLASAYENITADRRDEIDELVQQLGIVYVDNRRRLDQANTRIDSLVTQVAPSIERQDPER